MGGRGAVEGGQAMIWLRWGAVLAAVLAVLVIMWLTAGQATP